MSQAARLEVIALNTIKEKEIKSMSKAQIEAIRFEINNLILEYKIAKDEEDKAKEKKSNVLAKILDLVKKLGTTKEVLPMGKVTRIQSSYYEVDPNKVKDAFPKSWMTHYAKDEMTTKDYVRVTVN